MNGVYLVTVLACSAICGYFFGMLDGKSDQNVLERNLILECEKTLPRDVHCEVVYSARVVESDE